ncbi:MAG: metallophosphoesterase [Candidatus Kapaibacterium sp.]
MNPARFSMFWFFTVTLQILVDYYVLYNWQKFVKRRGYSPLLYQLPWVIAGLVLLGTLYSSPMLQSSFGFDAPAKRTFQLITVLWFLPKLLISLALLLKDIGRLFLLIYRKILRSTPRVPSTTINQDVEIPSTPRRDFLEKVAWTAAAAPFAIATNGMFRTAFDFQSYYQTVKIAGLPSQLSGLKIIQISDIHSGSFVSHRPFQEVRRLIDSHKPDLIVITGDYVNFRADELKVTHQELSKLKAPLGVYGSMGNHDHYMSPEDHELLKAGLRSTGLHLLVNNNTTISVDGATLNLAGIDNTGLGQNFGRLGDAMSGLNTSNPTILLAHDPTFWDKQVRGKIPVDLMLSGHTHGGQVGVHLLGEDYSFARVVYEQWAGLYTDKDQSLYVNRGIGMVGPPIRIAIEPEITVITLERPESTG